jgi:hypothetical protein
MLVIDTSKSFPRLLPKLARYSAWAALALAVPALARPLQAPQLPAPQLQAQHVTDSASEASPMVAPTAGPAMDTASDASPIGPASSTDAIPAGATLLVQFSGSLDSGSVHNGTMVRGELKAPVHTVSGRLLPAGTPVTATVIAAVPAGVFSSAGQLTLQVVRVGNIEVLSEIVSRIGQEGPRSVPDAIPAKGTEAVVAAGAELRFDIPPAPGI